MRPAHDAPCEQEASPLLLLRSAPHVPRGRSGRPSEAARSCLLGVLVMSKRRERTNPSKQQLEAVYRAVRSYCKRERADVDVGDADMAADWQRICVLVGVDPNPTRGKR